MDSTRQFVGEVIGNYRVLAQLGSAGMGTVYRAQDTRHISEMPGTAGYSFPSWSPDGKYFVAIAQNPSRMMLYTAETKTWRELKRFDVPWGYWTWARNGESLYMALVDNERGMYRLTVPEGKWEKLGGMERVSARDQDAFVSLAPDGQPAVMSHLGAAHAYALHWNR